MRGSTRRRLRWAIILALSLILLLTTLWIGWAEQNPSEERELRVLVQERLEQWFPEEMHPTSMGYGFVSMLPEPVNGAPRVLLVHGLDEPGGIWDDLVPVLADADYDVWEFRYPNDQALDQSADLLAKFWPTIEGAAPIVLIGHSMGGLVIRDFVTRWRHPVDSAPKVTGIPVQGVILVGTPNQGSDWARLRVWLEIRDSFATVLERRFSLFAGLRDGTGAAKIDLRPGSDFLEALNARPWPEPIPLGVIGGVLIETEGNLVSAFESLGRELGAEISTDALETWWSDLGEGVGDGVVPVESLTLEHMPPPILLRASHRGLLARMFPGDPQPPAIIPILELLEAYLAGAH
jgi:pimeloyl-ACP methyl ester carboxylesterase